MPVAGVARNPLGQAPGRFHRRRTLTAPRAGQTPGTMVLDTRADDVAQGTIRRLYRQAVNLILPAEQISWSYNNGQGVVTRALRYKAASTYRPAGADRTRFGAPRPIRPPRHRQSRPSKPAGNKATPPTVRNRLTSFGRRVPTANSPVRPR